MRFRLLFILLFFLQCWQVSAADSTDNKGNRPFSSPASRLKDSGINLYKKGEYDSALTVMYKAFDLSAEEKDSLLIAKCLNNIGLIFSSKGDPVKSFLYYGQSLAILKQLGNKDELAISLLNLGIAYKEQAIYDQALKYLFEAAALFENKADQRGLASAYNTIGNVLMLDKNYEKALEYHFLALNLRKELGYSEGVAGSLNNIGVVYKKMVRYDSALIYFKASLQLKDQVPANERTANTLSHMAELFAARNDFEGAERYYRQAFVIRQKMGNSKGMADSYYESGALKFKQGKYGEAESYLLKGVELAKEVSASAIRLQCYNLLRQIYRKQGKHQKALLYDESFIELSEQLLNEEKQKALLQMQIKYETEKKQQEIRELNQDRQRQEAALAAQAIQLEARKQRIAGLFVIIGLLVVILIMFGRYSRNKSRAAKRIDMLMRELHHRVKNNLQILSSLLGLQSEQLQDEGAREAVRSGESRVNAMMLIHQKLYFREQISKVSMKEYVGELVEGLRSAYGYDPDRIEVQLEVSEGLEMDVEKAIPLGLLANELLSNAFKYAFGNNNHVPVLQVKLHRNESGRYVLVIADNGPGIPQGDNKPQARSFGLRLVQSQVKQLRGEIHVSGEKGLRYEIVF